MAALANALRIYGVQVQTGQLSGAVCLAAEVSDGVFRNRHCTGWSDVGGRRKTKEEDMSQSHYLKGVGAALLTIVVVAVLMIVYENHVSGTSSGTYLDKLSETQKEALRWILDLVKLLISWAVAVIGATGFFLKLNTERNVPLRPADLYLSFAIIIFAVTSLFFGHLAMDRGSAVLSVHQYPITDMMFRSHVRYQYLAVLGATGLFGFHVFHFFLARIANDKGVNDGKP